MTHAPATYPSRGACYAHGYVRHLTSSCAAQEIGATACWLLSIIAHQEDAIRYARAVTYYDSQLQREMGLASQKTLADARNRAVEAGWLHYEPGHKSRPGRYWVTIPETDHEPGLPPDDHEMRGGFAVKNTVNPPQNGSENAANTPRNGHPLYPVPVPSPIQITHGDQLTWLTGPSEEFRRFFAAYPRPVSRSNAWREWQAVVAQLVRDMEITDLQVATYLIDRARAYAQSPAGMPPPPGQSDYRPSPGRWLRDGRYGDPPAEWDRPNMDSRAARKNTRKTKDTEDLDDLCDRVATGRLGPPAA